MPSKTIDLRIELVTHKGNARKPLEGTGTKSVHMDRIVSRFLELCDELNNRTGGNGVAELHERLIDVGRSMCDDLLPTTVKENLRKIENGEYLTLEIDDALSHIPWELLCVDDQFLCERFNMGRVVKTGQGLDEISTRELKPPYKMWVIANPSGDLDEAGKEAREIHKLIQTNSTIRLETDSEVTSDDIRERIKNADIYHFTGHADKGSLKLGKEELFKAFDTDNMHGGAPMPYLLFINACESGWWEESEHGSNGLAGAFIRAGGMHYIGASWKIISKPSKDFALAFYERLLSGGTLGEAVRHARLKLKEQKGKNRNICWAGYRLNGDPTDSIFKSDRNPAITNHVLKIQQADVRQNFESVQRQAYARPHADPPKPHSLPYKQSEIQQQKQAKSAPPDKAILRMWKNPKIKWAALVILVLSVLAGVSGKYLLFHDAWTSRPLTLAVVVDDLISDNLNVHKDYFVASTIEQQILSKTHIKLLERRRLPNLEREELILKRHMNGLDRAINFIKWRSGLLPAELMLFLYVNTSETESYVVMDLVDAVSGIKTQVFQEKLENNKFVSAQKERLSKSLLETLETLYPVRGRISKVDDDIIQLNIGTEIGVEKNQRFKVIDKDVILLISSSGTGQSAVMLEKGAIRLEEGWRVEAM